MITEKTDNCLKITLSALECLHYDIFKIIINPKTRSAKEILTELFLKAADSVDFLFFSGDFLVDIYITQNGEGTVCFTVDKHTVKIKRRNVCFKFKESNDLLDFISASKGELPNGAELFRVENKYFLTVPYKKQNLYLCGEYGQRLSSIAWRKLKPKADFILKN